MSSVRPVSWLATPLSLLWSCVAICIAPSAAHPGYAGGSGRAGLRTRSLLRDKASTIIYTIDFEELATQNITTGNTSFKEKELRGALPLHPKTQEVQYGAFDMGPEMVAELTTMISEQLVRIS